MTPDFEAGEYWSTFAQGVERAREEYASYNVVIHHLFFDQYDKSSFDLLIDQLEDKECQGVVVATLFKESVVKLASLLDAREIPYIQVDAHISEINSISYYGPHSFNSGFIAGRLMNALIDRDENMAIFRFIRKGELYSTQVQIREQGFRNYLAENNYNGKIHYVNIHADNTEENRLILDNFFAQYPDVKNGIIFNSRAHLLGHYLNERNDLQEFKLIGYDVIEENIEYMNKGFITHLIAQRPEVQGVNSIKALFKYLVLNETPEPINYMPIDILMKENIQFYNNYI